MHRIQQPVPLRVEGVAPDAILDLDGGFFLRAIRNQVLFHVLHQVRFIHDFAEHERDKHVVHRLDVLPHQIVQIRRFLLEDLEVQRVFAAQRIQNFRGNLHARFAHLAMEHFLPEYVPEINVEQRAIVRHHQIV